MTLDALPCPDCGTPILLVVPLGGGAPIRLVPRAIAGAGAWILYPSRQPPHCGPMAAIHQAMNCAGYAEHVCKEGE